MGCRNREAFTRSCSCSSSSGDREACFASAARTVARRGSAIVYPQIAEALEPAQEQAIVHRDLKPLNIKLWPDDIVKVLDFGLGPRLSTRPFAAFAFNWTSPHRRRLPPWR